jgi:hypothetical protein
MAAQEAAPGVKLGGELRGGDDIDIGGDGANSRTHRLYQATCLGCGILTADPERHCPNCRRSDATRHG